MQFQITHRFSGAVIFECELSAEVETAQYSAQLGFAVRVAYKARAYLSGADLRGADLSDAYLRDAYLRDADGKKLTLVGSRPVFQIGPLGSRADTLMVFLTDSGLHFRAGCFFGDLDHFRAAVLETHGETSPHAVEYAAAISLAQQHARLWSGEQS